MAEYEVIIIKRVQANHPMDALIDAAAIWPYSVEVTNLMGDVEVEMSGSEFVEWFESNYRAGELK